VAVVTDSMIKHFIFHICWISVLKFLCFNFLPASFCITFRSEDIATSLSLVFNYYV
jgi:hypothetical protein